VGPNQTGTLIEQHRRADGGLTARVIWRPGGARDATRVWETFGAGSDAQNLARADGVKRMVEAAGQRWPDGWVKGEGFVRPPDIADPMTPPPAFDKIGEEYVRQIVDLSPGQRKRYVGQLQLLARTPVRGSLVFAGPVTAIGEAQLKTWLIEWDRSLKTKSELPRSDLRRIRVRREARLSGCEPGNRDGAEAVEGEAVEAGAAVLDRAGVGDRRPAGQETWGHAGCDGRNGIAVR
jgi:hypothetical protein